MSEAGRLDPAALDRLQRLGGNAFVCKMIDVFVEYAGQKIVDGRTAFSAGDLRALEMAAHPIKSSAGNIGATRMQALAAQIEALASEKKAELIPPLLDALEQDFQLIRPELDQARLRFPAAAQP